MFWSTTIALSLTALTATTSIPSASPACPASARALHVWTQPDVLTVYQGTTTSMTTPGPVLTTLYPAPQGTLRTQPTLFAETVQSGV